MCNQISSRSYLLSVGRVIFLVFFLQVFLIQNLFSKSKNEITQDSSFKTTVFSVTNRQLSYDSDSVLVFEHWVDTVGGLKYIRSDFDGQKWTNEQFSSLDELINIAVDYNDWMVFVHGDGKTFEGAVETAAEIQKLYQVNVLLFSWPSSNPDLSPITNFKNSRNNVVKGSKNFTQLILEVSELEKLREGPFENQNLTLFCHSLGNYYYELMGSDSINHFAGAVIFDNLVINSAAVSGEAHNEWVENLKIQKRIYINSNAGDLNLAGLKWLTKLGIQLGEMPVGPLAVNAIYVNFTSAVGVRMPPGPSHSYYYSTITAESTNIKNYYSDLFHGRQINFSNGLFVQNLEFPGYSISF